MFVIDHFYYEKNLRDLARQIISNLNELGRKIVRLIGGFACKMYGVTRWRSQQRRIYFENFFKVIYYWNNNFISNHYQIHVVFGNGVLQMECIICQLR